jgi:hypothetical protein
MLSTYNNCTRQTCAHESCVSHLITRYTYNLVLTTQISTINISTIILIPPQCNLTSIHPFISLSKSNVIKFASSSQLPLSKLTVLKKLRTKTVPLINFPVLIRLTVSVGIASYKCWSFAITGGFKNKLPPQPCMRMLCLVKYPMLCFVRVPCHAYPNCYFKIPSTRNTPSRRNVGANNDVELFSGDGLIDLV